MTEQDKQLLLKDLCARLPYGVKVVFDDGNPAHKTCDMTLYGVDIWSKQVSTGNGYFIYDIEYVKPYLRPMSSMTKEEKFDIGRLLVDYGEGLPTDMYIDEVIDNSIVIDYLLEHHFDYRGLIEKGLALPAPPDMYK